MGFHFIDNLKPVNRSETSTTITPDDLRRLVALVDENELTELRYEQGDIRVTLRTAAFFRERGTSVATVAASVAPSPFVSESEEEEVDGEPDAFSSPVSPGIRIEAPVMGTFYRSASPSDPPFVEVGDTVEIGQPIGLIEAMKVFSEVKSEVSGVVREIVAANKVQVQPGDTLLILDGA